VVEKPAVSFLAPFFWSYSILSQMRILGINCSRVLQVGCLYCQVLPNLQSKHEEEFKALMPTREKSLLDIILSA